jgi:hypothetical protein
MVIVDTMAILVMQFQVRGYIIRKKNCLKINIHYQKKNQPVRES